MHVSTFIRITTFLSVWSPVSGAERTSGAKGEGGGQSVCIYTIIETLARTWRVIKRSRVDSAHDRYLWSWSPVMLAITGSLEHQIRSSSKVGPSLTTPWHYHDGRDTCLQIFISPWIRDESLKSLWLRTRVNRSLALAKFVRKKLRYTYCDVNEIISAVNAIYNL